MDRISWMAPSIIACALLAACATGGGGKLQAVNLPKEPACMAPVDRPTLAPGTSRKVALLKTDKALDQANSNIICSRTWYRGVRKEYASRGEKKK